MRRFNPPPNWPAAPSGWTPPPGWEPDATWPPPPAGWQLWVEDGNSSRSWVLPVQITVGVLWLIFLVAGLASGGFSGFTVMLGLPLLLIGLGALAVGHANWALLGRRLSAGIAAGAGLALVIVGGATAAPTTPARVAAVPTSAAPVPTTTSTPPTPSPTPVATPAAEVVVVDGVAFPDNGITRGATVAGASLGAVCSAAWVPVHLSIDASVADAVFEAYGIGSADRTSYELDRLIPNELGGSGTLDNLWPQPLSSLATNATAVAKDDLEKHLRALVCAKRVDLATARRSLVTNWSTAYRQYINVAVPKPAPVVQKPTPKPTTARPTYVPPPVVVVPPPSGDPAGVTAQCRDGSYSYSQHRSGTCSHHGGVARWINRPAS
jgi:hypothetical protein